MKNDPYSINLSKVCRLCFEEKTVLSPIFDNISIPDLTIKIQQCVSIEVSSDDQLPDQICDDCFREISNWITFKQKCCEADSNLKNYVQSNIVKEESGEDEDNVENVDSYDSDSQILVNLLLSDENDDIVKPRRQSDKSTVKSTTKSARTKKYQTDQERRALYRQKYYQYQRKSYPCDICDKKFTRFCDLFNHDKMDHENLPRNSMCNVCGKLFVSDNRVSIHKSRYHGEKPFTCDICEKKFLTKRTLQKHMIIHNKCFTCPHCNLSTSSNSSLIEHIRVHTREKPFTCDECGNSYISQQGLNSHKKTHSSEKLFMCDICGYSARNQSSIYIHKGSHSNVKPFICETCGKAFKSKIRLNEHHRRHTAVKRFTCDTCNISFRQNYQLIKHYRVHSGEKPFTCDVCNKSFARSDSLKEHKRIHTGEKRYTCEVCLKAFSFLKPFKTHKCITNI